MRRKRTFVFEEIAHSSSSSEDQLRDVLDNLRFVLGREGGEPLGEALEAGKVSTSRSRSRAKVTTHDFALAREENEVPGRTVSSGDGRVRWASLDT